MACVYMYSSSHTTDLLHMALGSLEDHHRFDISISVIKCLKADGLLTDIAHVDTHITKWFFYGLGKQ